jgi:hypothetical protein
VPGDVAFAILQMLRRQAERHPHLRRSEAQPMCETGSICHDQISFLIAAITKQHWHANNFAVANNRVVVVRGASDNEGRGHELAPQRSGQK